MVTLVKFKDSKNVIYFSGWIKNDNDVIYTNEKAIEIARQKGYKELICDKIPEYNSISQYIDFKYIEEDYCIRKVWELCNYADYTDKM